MFGMARKWQGGSYDQINGKNWLDQTKYPNINKIDKTDKRVRLSEKQSDFVCLNLCFNYISYDHCCLIRHARMQQKRNKI